jgi:hypothetical protein
MAVHQCLAWVIQRAILANLPWAHTSVTGNIGTFNSLTLVFTGSLYPLTHLP